MSGTVAWIESVLGASKRASKTSVCLRGRLGRAEKAQTRTYLYSINGVDFQFVASDR